MYNDIMYTTFMMAFFIAYFILPMIMVSVQHNINAYNIAVIIFFLVYFIFDIVFKIASKDSCFSGIETKNYALLIGINSIFGLFVGGAIVTFMYGTALKTYLFINDFNSNKEVCSMPSEQKFKCNVYKNGTLIGNI